MSIHLTRDKWYEIRDDRTARIVTADFSNHAVGILLDPDCKDLFSHQCMTYMACNILSRWCRRLVMDLPDVECVLPNHQRQNFKEVIGNSVRSIDPYGNFQFGKTDDGGVDQTLVIGSHGKTDSKSTVWIDANGWIAGCGTNSSKCSVIHDRSYNPIGPSFASCLGVAQIFEHAVGNNRSIEYQKWLSLFDFGMSVHHPCRLQNPEFATDFDYGEVHQIGCGAVGSSLDALISLTGWKIDLWLIDHDVVNYSNCNRSLPFSFHDALQEKHKVDVCGKILENMNRHICAVPKTYYEFTGEESFAERRPDLVLSLANENNVWSTIQDNYPPIVIHAATTQSWGINLGRHIPNLSTASCALSQNSSTARTSPNAILGRYPPKTRNPCSVFCPFCLRLRQF